MKYSQGDLVYYKNKEGSVRFCYPEYKPGKNAYMVTLFNYRGYPKIDTLVYEDELYQYDQLSLFK